MDFFQFLSHIDIIYLFQYFIILVNRSWRTTNGAVNRFRRVKGVFGTDSVKVPTGYYGWFLVVGGRQTLIGDRYCIYIIISCRQPRFTNGLVCTSPISHEICSKQVQGTSLSTTKVGIWDGSWIPSPIPIVHGKLRIDLPKHLLQPIYNFSVPWYEFWAIMDMCSLVYFVLFKPPSYTTRYPHTIYAIVSASWKTPLIKFNE